MLIGGRRSKERGAYFKVRDKIYMKSQNIVVNF